MNFHDKLIKLRKQNAFSQEELADKLGVSRQAISRWELGSTYPDVPNLLKICKLFDVSADYLINDDNDNQEKPVLEQTEALTEDSIPNKEENKPTLLNRIKQNIYLITGFIWVLAAFCFLFTALLDLKSIYVPTYIVLASIDILIAFVNFFTYFIRQRHLQKSH